MNALCMPGSTRATRPEVDVADEAPRARALDVQLLHHALLEHRDARFLGRYVDEDYAHAGDIGTHGRY